MTASDGTRRLANRISLATLAWLIVYVPAETYVTLSIAGLPGLLYSGYIMNVVGMALMFWGAATARRFEPAGPALLAIGWSWTAATFWRATADRFWWVSQGHGLWAGPVELWLGPLFTALTVGFLIASMVLVFRTAGGAATSSR